MRELADWNVSRYAEIAAWPLREALLAMVEKMKRLAFDAYERQIDRWHHGRRVEDTPTPSPLIAGDLTAEHERVSDG